MRGRATIGTPRIHVSRHGGEGMRDLPDDLLLEAYQKAIELQLDLLFIQLLGDEIRRRGLLQ